MAWIRRGPHRYYSNYERKGKVVRRVNYGNGPLAELAAGLDKLKQIERQARARVWRDDQARYEAADDVLDGLSHATDLLTETVLARAGYFRHDRGSFRKRRIMTNTTISPIAEAMTSEDIQEILERAQRGDRLVLPMLRQLLDTNPQIWQNLGDLAAHAQQAWVDLVAGADLIFGESLMRKLQEMKDKLAGPAITPLETILVERIVSCWLQLHHADALFCQSKDRGLSLAQLDHLQRRMLRAQRGYLASTKALATIRKLLPAVVPQPLAAAVPECVGEVLRREAKAARRGGSAKHVDKAPKVTTKSATKSRQMQTIKGSHKATQRAAIPEPLRDPCAA